MTDFHFRTPKSKKSVLAR
jgi:hypothetical protein